MSVSERRIQLTSWALAMLPVLLSIGQMAQSGTTPWRTIAGVFALTVVCVGPASWVVRESVAEARRRRLAMVGVVVALLLGQVALGFALAFGVPVLSSFHGSIVGFGLGILAVAGIEQLFVPEQLRTEWIQ